MEDVRSALIGVRKASHVCDSCILLWYPRETGTSAEPLGEEPGTFFPRENTRSCYHPEQPKEARWKRPASQLNFKQLAAAVGGSPAGVFAAEYFRADQSYNKLNPQFRLSPSEVNLKQHLCTARTFLHNKTLPLLCAGTCIHATNILASRHRAVRGHVSPHPTAQQLPARLCMGGNCAQNRSCNTHCSHWHGLLYHPARGSQASSHRSHTWD